MRVYRFFLHSEASELDEEISGGLVLLQGPPAVVPVGVGARGTVWEAVGGSNGGSVSPNLGIFTAS